MWRIPASSGAVCYRWKKPRSHHDKIFWLWATHPPCRLSKPLSNIGNLSSSPRARAPGTDSLAAVLVLRFAGGSCRRWDVEMR